MPLYTGSKPMDLSSAIHGEVSGAAVFAHKAKIVSLLDSGNAAHLSTLKNHVGREYFRKLDQFGLTGSAYITDPHDAGFRPTAVTGLYA